MPNMIELEFAELPYAINEEMKTLRTNIQFCGKEKKVILMTSAVQNEGKTTLSLNLCRSIAELGKSVLLIDADLRKSVVKDRLVSGKIYKGLSHLLSGQCELSDVFCKDKGTGIYLLPTGDYPPNPVELLASEDMQELMKSARSRFDYVIVDCAPLGVVTDAAVIAPLCDGAIIVLNAGEVHYKLAQQVTTRLKNTGCTVLGVVLNQVNHQSNGRYYGKRYGYYKHYGRYGKYGYYKRYGRYYYASAYKAEKASEANKAKKEDRKGHTQRSR